MTLTDPRNCRHVATNDRCLKKREHEVLRNNVKELVSVKNPLHIN